MEINEASRIQIKFTAFRDPFNLTLSQCLFGSSCISLKWGLHRLGTSHFQRKLWMFSFLQKPRMISLLPCRYKNYLRRDRQSPCLLPPAMKPVLTVWQYTDVLKLQHLNKLVWTAPHCVTSQWDLPILYGKFCHISCWWRISVDGKLSQLKQ